MKVEKNRFYNLAKKVFNIVFKKFYKAKFIGIENIPDDGPIIIAGNHNHYFDPCLVFISTDRKVNYIMKKSCYNNKLIGWIFKKMDCLSVDHYTSMKEALKILHNNGAIGIFPEGTRNKTKNLLLPFKMGTISMASKTNSYIVPFGRTGSFNLFKRTLIIRFGKPFKVDNMSLQEATNKLKNEVEKLMKMNLKNNNR